ncbi:MAG TPA: PDZ domain-containing protein [Bacteroidota bacterium]|nr:PDZ domain-containing protein [Bacteroidota bacterium]
MKKIIILVSLLISFVFAQDETRLLRFPNIYGDQIVFAYAGDLFIVSSNGGIARRLTNDIGYEMFPHFSPDGKMIAFTAEYDGNTEVYVMPSDGGIPKRITYTATLKRDDVSDRMGPNNIVMGWTKDGKKVIFRSRMKSFNAFKGRIYLANLDGSLPEELPLPHGGFCSFSPDGKKLAYNSVFREFRTWKRYRGGMADDIRIYDFNTKKTEKITNNNASDIFPMWYGDKIYFISDREENNKRMNLYSYDLVTKETKKLTNFKDYDIKFPSLGDKAIVFENGGYIYKFDLSTEAYSKIPIVIKEDMAKSRGGLIDVNKNITSIDISPDGKRAVFGARGDVFTIPAKNGVIRNITATSGIHERNSVWSPNGKWIAFISDETGEDEIYIKADEPNAKSIQLTKNSDTYKYQIVWSPDSKKILWADKMLRLRYLDIDTKEITEIDKATAFEFTNYSWSPDSKWVAYMRPENDAMDKVYIYSLDKKEKYQITDEWFDSGNPVFSSDGKYLFFVSSRDFNPIYGSNEFNVVYRDMQKIYLITLSKDIESPFKPKSDEVVSEEKSDIAKSIEKKDDKKDNDKKSEKVSVKIDIDGIKERITVLPIAPSNYRKLISVNDKLYYMRVGSRDTKPLLLMYDLTKQSEVELGNINNYEISFDKKKMLVSQDGSYAIIDLPQTKIEIKDKLNTTGLETFVNKKEEWKQIYNECWRQMRDFFYAPNMHGVNWQEVKKKYEELIPFVNCRQDLTYIIGEMIGELNCGHTYVGGGDIQRGKRIPMGLLGAELEQDINTKFYRIKRILKGQNWDKSLRSPLTEIGVNVKEGDYIIEIDGTSTNKVNNIYELLINKANKQVKLKINSIPSDKGSREVTVLPIDDESSLYYFNWVQSNIEKVNKATNGQVGYIHIPDMSAQGLNEFVKYYYPQLQKKALIIDDRGNGGGNVSPIITERLRREWAFINMARNTSPSVDPVGTFIGPKVLLLDEYSASDGDLFPYRFRKHNLGKLIGKRSWGGVVGIRGTLPLIDGGELNKPEFAKYDTEGKDWVIEGFGVEPDIMIENDPAKEYEGVDDQLNKAIEVILQELKTKEKTIPPIPKYPDKSK